jgi:hypothetical protein
MAALVNDATSKQYRTVVSSFEGTPKKSRGLDRSKFENKLKLNPNRYSQFVDLIKPKGPAPLKSRIFGKPNLVINQQGHHQGTYTNKSLKKFSPRELVQIADNFSNAKFGSSAVVTKILERIERENNDNEFNRTEIQDRTHHLVDKLTKPEYDFYATGAVRIIDSIESSSNGRSYFNRMLK